MATCSSVDQEAIQDAVRHYDELLGPVAERYNSVHEYIYHILCVVGVLANVCIVVVLLRAPMRRNPFNLFLVAIALCDGILMSSYLLFKQVEICHPWYFSFPWTVFTVGYAILSVFVHSVSLWLTVNMAVLRYLVLRESSTSGASKLNNYKSAMIAIGAALGISFVGAAPNMLRYRIEDRGLADVPRSCFLDKYGHHYTFGQKVHNYVLARPHFWNCSWERFSFWAAGMLLKIIPCLLLTVFMTLLVRMLVEARDRRSRLCSAAGSASGNQIPQNPPAGGGKAQAERTTAMLILIVAVFLITELPQGVLVIASGVHSTFLFAMPHLGNFVDLLSLLNSSVNFILYSTMSAMFRREFLSTFGFCCPKPFRRWHSALRSDGTQRRRSMPRNGGEQSERLITNGTAL